MRPERRKRSPSGSTTSTRGITMAAAAAAPATSPLFSVLFPDYEKSAGEIRPCLDFR